MGFFHTYLNNFFYICATLSADSTQTIISHKLIKTMMNKQTNFYLPGGGGCAVITAGV